MIACCFRGCSEDLMSAPFVVIEGARVTRQPQWLGLMDGALLRIGEEVHLDGNRHTVPIIGLSGPEARVGLDAAHVTFSHSGRYVAWSVGMTLLVFDRNTGATFEVPLSTTERSVTVHGVKWIGESEIHVDCTGSCGHRCQQYLFYKGLSYKTSALPEAVKPLVLDDRTSHEFQQTTHAAFSARLNAFDARTGLMAAVIKPGELTVWDLERWIRHQLGTNFSTYQLGGLEMTTPNSHIIHSLEWLPGKVLRVAVARVESNPNPAFDVSCVYSNGVWHAELLELRF